MFFDAIFIIGTIVIQHFVETAVTEVIRHWNFNQREKQSQQRLQNPQSNKTAKEKVKEIEVIDTELIDLENKYQRDGRITTADQDRAEELEIMRSNFFDEYRTAKTNEIQQEQIAHPDNYAASVLDDAKVHILQYHMGQIVLEKQCRVPGCRRPMFLQSRQRLDGTLYQLRDFFWSCTGYYNNPGPFHSQGRLKMLEFQTDPLFVQG